MNPWKACLSLLLLLSGLARAAVTTGEMDAYSESVIVTNYTDSRVQFLLSPEDLTSGFYTEGAISGMTMYLGPTVPDYSVNITISMKSVYYSEISSNSFTQAGFDVVFDGDVDCASLVPYGELEFNFGANWFAYSSSSGILVDVCVESSGTSSLFDIAVCYTTGRQLMVVRGSSTGDFCGMYYGSLASVRPIVRLEGISHILTSDITVWDSPLHLWGGDFMPIDYDSLTIEAGVEIVFDTPGQLIGGGYLRAVGTEEAPIVIHAADGGNWMGMHLSGSDRIAWLDISDVSGTGLFLYSNQPVIEGLHFHDNNGPVCVYYMANGTTLKNCVIRENAGAALYTSADFFTLYLEKCLIVENQSAGNTALFSFSSFTSPTLTDCTIADNIGYDTVFQGPSSTLVCRQCALDNPDLNAVGTMGNFSFQYCASSSDPGDFNNAYSYSWTNCVFGDPGFSPFLGDYVPQPGSILVDAGHPLRQDPDLTRADIGAMYYDQAVPVIQTIADVPDDQGHALIMSWSASSVDLNQVSGAECFYSVWRMDDDQWARGLVCESLEQADAILRVTPECELFVRDSRSLVWTFVEQVPARGLETYGLVVPTLYDNDYSMFQVCWHHPGYLGVSEYLGAVSIDNVTPDSPVIRCITEDGSVVTLFWDAVANGTSSAGLQLRELGQIRYRVYYSDNPWFSDGAGVLLQETDQTQVSLSVPAEPSRGFYRVVAVDQGE